MIVVLNFSRWRYVLSKHNAIYKSVARRLMDDVGLQQLAAHPEAPPTCYFIFLVSSTFALVLEGFEKRALLPLSE